MRSDRLLAILLTLQARGRATAPELAERLEVSVRTVYRDVEALSSAGVPVYTEQGRGGGICLLAGYRTDATGLTRDEARALFTFSGRGVFGDTGQDRALQSAFRKLLAALPEAQQAQAAQAEERILVEPRPWGRRRTDHAPALATIQQAVLAGERIRMRYRAAGRAEPGEYLLDPVGLVVKAGVWYLVAYRDGESRMFRLSRVVDAEPAGPARLPADVPPLDELWDQMRSRFEQPGGGVQATVAVGSDDVGRLLGTVNTYLIDRPERRSDPERPDHELVVLTFRAIPQAAVALLPLVELSEVVDPPELRDELARMARVALDRYNGPA